jgi:hypothetical protein
MSAIGTKQTSPGALHVSAFDRQLTTNQQSLGVDAYQPLLMLVVALHWGFVCLVSAQFVVSGDLLRREYRNR